jgi:hypothetical protein
MKITQEMPMSKAFVHAREHRGMTEPRDKTDSKSGGGNIVLVRVRPGAPDFRRVRRLSALSP